MRRPGRPFQPRDSQQSSINIDEHPFRQSVQSYHERISPCKFINCNSDASGRLVVFVDRRARETAYLYEPIGVYICLNLTGRGVGISNTCWCRLLHLLQAAECPLGPGPHFSTHTPSLNFPAVPHSRHIRWPSVFAVGKSPVPACGQPAIDQHRRGCRSLFKGGTERASHVRSRRVSLRGSRNRNWRWGASRPSLTSGRCI